MSPTLDVILGTGLTACVVLMAWILSRISDLLIKQALTTRNADLDERIVEKLTGQVQDLTEKLAEQTRETAELRRAMADFQVALAAFVRAYESQPGKS